MKRKRRTPKKQLQLIYDMACEMSNCTTYMVPIDDEGNHGETDPKVVAALETVRKFFGLEKG